MKKAYKRPQRDILSPPLMLSSQPALTPTPSVSAQPNAQDSLLESWWSEGTGGQPYRRTSS